MLFGLVALSCSTCFLLCPRRPLPLKLIALALAAHGLFWALYAVVYYYLHSVYQV
jgi:hypothetical protein